MNAKELMLYREPREGAFRSIESIRAGSVSPASLPDALVDLSTLFDL